MKTEKADRRFSKIKKAKASYYCSRTNSWSVGHMNMLLVLVFADNIECMSNFQDRDSYKQCRNKTTEVIQTKAATGRVDPNEACRYRL